MDDHELRLRNHLSRIADEAELRPELRKPTLEKAQTRKRVIFGTGAGLALLVGTLALTVLPDLSLRQTAPLIPAPDRSENERNEDGFRIETKELGLSDQPSALTTARGSLWVSVAMRRQLLEIREGRIVNRLPGGGVGLAIADGIAWQTMGGDGAVPDGTLLGIDVGSGNVVQRVQFPAESPYGVDVGPDGVFAALSQGDLVRLHPGGDEYERIPLGHGLRDVLVAHGAVWVSQPEESTIWRVTLDDGADPQAIDLATSAKRSCPAGLAATRGGIWAADACGATVWQLDRAGTPVQRIYNVGKKPADVAAGSRYLFVSSFRGDHVVTLVDYRSGEAVAQVKVGEGPSSVAASGREAWVANSEERSLTHIVVRRQTRRDRADR